MDVVFSDLDGTLLDHDTYSWEAARSALACLRARVIPLIFVTSKTRAEVEFWRERLGNYHPFVVENGGAIFLPQNYFCPPTAATRLMSYQVIELGQRYEHLLAALRAASEQSRCRVLGFHAMTAEEVARQCGLPVDLARLAKQREYDEPFVILDPGLEQNLVSAIEQQGLRWTRGGRFHHILGNNDKTTAVRQLTRLFQQVGVKLRTIGLGNGLNDVGFLNCVDVPILIRSPSSAELQTRVPHGRLTEKSGSQGWNEAVLELFAG